MKMVLDTRRLLRTLSFLPLVLALGAAAGCSSDSSGAMLGVVIEEVESEELERWGPIPGRRTR